MTAGEIILLIGSIGGFITGIIAAIVAALTARSAASKDEIASLRATIEALQHENQRLFLRVQDYESKLAHMQAEIDDRERRIEILEGSLKDATRASADRAARIIELENKVKQLEERRKS
jgi:chromosome segregation ATPase